MVNDRNAPGIEGVGGVVGVALNHFYEQTYRSKDRVETGSGPGLRVDEIDPDLNRIVTRGVGGSGGLDGVGGATRLFEAVGLRYWRKMVGMVG